MTIYDVLKRDHRQIRELTRRLQNSSKSTYLRHDLLEELRTTLLAHSRAEEKVLYDTLKEIAGTDDLALESYEEHSVNEALLRELELVNPADERWQAKLHVFIENLEHHVVEEENETFASARQVLAPEEAVMMGQAYESLVRQLGEGSLLQSAIESVAQFMPARFSQRFTDLTKKVVRN